VGAVVLHGALGAKPKAYSVRCRVADEAARQACTSNSTSLLQRCGLAGKGTAALLERITDGTLLHAFDSQLPAQPLAGSAAASSAQCRQLVHTQAKLKLTEDALKAARKQLKDAAATTKKANEAHRSRKRYLKRTAAAMDAAAADPARPSDRTQRRRMHELRCALFV
jgi:hypothetical protein